MPRCQSLRRAAAALACAAALSTGASARGQGAPPAAPPPARAEAKPEPEAPRRPREGVNHGPRAELGLRVLSPDDEARTGAFGAALGVDAIGVVGDTFGLTLGYDASLGFDVDKNFAGDLRVGIGPGLKKDHVLLFAPVLGVGFDALGGGDHDSYKMDLSAYWYIEGRLRLAAPLVGVEGAVSRAARGGFDAEAAADAPYEVRVLVRVFHVLENGFELAVGFTYVDYATAEAHGGLAGFGF